MTGFSTTGGTTLDLRDIGFTGPGEATFAGTATSGVLAVSDGVHTAHIRLVEDYLGSTFVASRDGHGGVSIVGATAQAHLLTAAMAPPPAVASPHPSTHAMVAAMAGLGAAAGSAIATTARDEGWRPILLGPRAQLA